MVGVLFFACSDDKADLPSSYEFTSKFDNKSSVSYSGQTLRQVLVVAIKAEIGKIANEVREGTYNPANADAVKGRLTKFYTFDSAANGTEEHPISKDPVTLQTTFDDISTDKDLKAKVAGQDSQSHWGKGSNKSVVGWSGNRIPDDLINHWFDELSKSCHGSSTSNRANCHVTASGLDYQQLLEKFLLGAVNFSQGAGDYLDDGTHNKGILSDNTKAAKEGANYTELEHAWDEAFGYFGAARDYGKYADKEIKGGTRKDTNSDGKIDLKSEYNFSASVNAGKRDAGAKAGTTDFTGDAWIAFLTGRKIITDNKEISGSLLDDLKKQRDNAVLAWEKAIAATVVHYINDVLQDMAKIGDAGYSSTTHAKHWSEMKGFALSLQFNPRSRVSASDFVEMHKKMREATVLSSNDAAYRQDLISARNILKKSYGFADANIGDNDGKNGW